MTIEEMSSSDVVDLRSDTVTRPTAEMYKAMANAKVGDDVFMEDPTVNLLEQEAAEMLGKEDALYVPTCTMANLLAILVHCPSRLNEMIVGNLQHIHLYECGGSAALGGVHAAVLPNTSSGTLDLQQIAEAVRYEDVHMPVTKMIALENTHNSCGGIPLPLKYIDDVGRLGANVGARVHIDGARLFNASVATKIPPSRICRNVDSVSICLSKGLASPVGALFAGDTAMIKRARHLRKALGGGMRQVGVVAAAGLVSLRSMVLRLEEDHASAKRLAEGLHKLEHITVDMDAVQTNMVYFDVADNRANELVAELEAQHGVLVGAYNTKKVRIVTHKDAPWIEWTVLLKLFGLPQRASFLSDRDGCTHPSIFAHRA